MPDTIAAPPAAAGGTGGNPAPPTPPPAKPAPSPIARAEAPGKPLATSGKPVSKPSTDLNNAYDQLDRMAARGEDTEDSEPDGKTTGQPTGDETPDEQTPEDAKPEGAEKPNAQGGPPQGGKAGTLRQLKDQAESKLKIAEARIKELEAANTAPKEHPEFKKVSETLAQREKRLTELEDEVRYSNYERSGEYKEKYETPFVDAYGAGRRKVESFKLVDPTTGAERMGTAQDFDSFMRITDDNDAAEKAAELFGNKAPMVMYHREQVQSLNAARTKAVEEFRKNGGEREKARSEARTRQQQELAKLWESEAQSAVENPKYAPWFKAPVGDEVGAELLAKGFEFADEAFGKASKGPDGKPVARSPQEMAKMHAAVRNKAAAFDYQIHRNQVLTRQLREMKKKLASFEASVPGPGNGRGSKPAGPMGTWAAVEADLTRRAGR